MLSVWTLRYVEFRTAAQHVPSRISFQPSPWLKPGSHQSNLRFSIYFVVSPLPVQCPLRWKARAELPVERADLGFNLHYTCKFHMAKFAVLWPGLHLQHQVGQQTRRSWFGFLTDRDVQFKCYVWLFVWSWKWWLTVAPFAKSSVAIMMPIMHALNGNMKTVAQNFQDSVSTWFSLKKRFLNLLSKQPLGTEHFSLSKPLDWRKQCFTVSHIFAAQTKVRIPTELGPIWVPFEYYMLRKKKTGLFAVVAPVTRAAQGCHRLEKHGLAVSNRRCFPSFDLVL